MKTALKRLTSAFLAMCILVMSFNFVIASNEYPDAKLVFSGFTLRYGANGKIQGLVDISLENIDATGVNFLMEYDSNYLVPSDYDTNDATATFEDMFEQNLTAFPITTDEYGDKHNSLGFGSDLFFSQIYPEDFLIETNLFPSPDAQNSEYIGEKTYSYPDEKLIKCILANGRSVPLGTMSFQIVDPAAVANMTSADLANILSLTSDDVNIIYVDSDGKEQFVDVIEGEWNVDNTLIDVIPADDEKTVTAYKIYGDGTINDLINYLNSEMSTVIQRYSNGQQFLDTIVWDNSDPTENGFTVDQTYDPLGGLTYTVSQTYMDKTVTVKVNVTRVTITGFDYKNRIKTFIDPDRPAVWADLEMPDKVTPVLDGIDDMYIPVSEYPGQTDWTPADVTENLKTGTAPLSETYIHTVDSSLIVEPWLTVPVDFNWDIDAIRYVTDSDFTPDTDTVTAEVERETGILNIHVGTIGGGNPVEAGMGFNIYLPNGMVIKSADNDFVTITVNADGTADIAIDALLAGATTVFSDADREIIQSIINLGTNGFKLTAVKNSIESNQVPFSFDPRVNYYLGENGTSYVEKDYSEGRMTMFPVYAGQSLSDIATYIEFPDESVIPIAYHGITGFQPSEYDAAKVISWEIEGDPTATQLPVAGETVTLIGTLEYYSYTNFGYVQNPDNIQLKIKVTTSDVLPPTAEEQIKITTNTGYVDVQLTDGMTFNFDKKQVGYAPADVQEQIFTVENIGMVDINEISARISEITGDTNSSASSYVMTDAISVEVLTVGDTTTFAIRTMCGLPVGVYTARVSVGSSTDAELDGFNISFEVTANPVYWVNVVVDNANIGIGYLMSEDGTEVNSRTYEKDETVTLYARVIDTAYKFDEWETEDAISIAAPHQLITTFPMIAEDVEVKPTFMESPLVWMRLVDLEDFNEDNSENYLRVNTSPYAITTYNETIYDYRVIVNGDEEKNYVKFQLKEKLAEDITVDVKVNGTSCPYTQTDTVYFTSDLYDLNEGFNTVEIILKYTDPGDSQQYTLTYTLTILRRKAVDVTVSYGNSPFGLIEAASNITDKTTAKQYFHDNHTYGIDNVPEGAVSTYQTMYYTDAWTATNYDEDPYALFVYSDTVFVDPGFTNLKDSDGNAVDPTTVKRKIEFDTLISVTSDVLTDLQSVNIQPATVTIPSGGEQCVIDLTAYNIRPGVYSIEYSFNDIDGAERTFKKPLIILARKGDVTLDKTISDVDFHTIYQRIGNGFYDQILNSTDEWAMLYAYRVGDVTEDRNVNSIDANAIKNTAMTEYYEPLPTSIGQTLPTYDASTAVWTPTATLPPNKATLALDYLGTGTQPIGQAQTPNLTAEDIGATVWVGIGIRNPQNLEYFKQGFYSMDLAIDYDPTIFAPCDDFGRVDGDTGFNIADAITYHNINTSVTTSDAEFWSNAELYSQSLITDAALDDTGKYKTEFVTILSNDGTDLRMNNIAATDDTLYMLRVPFKLLAYPDASYTGTAITINLTEQTLVMGSGTTGTEASGGWEGAIDKTTEVNNLENHFDVEIVDIFNTDGKFNITGKVQGWNMKQPFKVEVYKSDDTTGVPFYTFLSNELDELGQIKYGPTTQTSKKGECEWEFELPVSNRFEYRIVISKLSHLTYPEIAITDDGIVNDVFTVADTITLVCGDINGDEIIKLPDRAELMRFLNRQKPWELYKDRFEAADLNGDEVVTLFDLNLLNQNYGKAYSVAAPAPTPTAAPGTVSTNGGGESSS